MVTPPRKRRWGRWSVVVVGVLGIVGFVYLALPGRQKYTISAETTVATGPIDVDGSVDYAAALHERASQGIDPNENACVLIWEAVGPRPEGGNYLPDDYYQWLGTVRPPDVGEYAVSWDKFVRESLQAKQINHLEWYERVDRCRKWPWKGADQPDVADWLQINAKPLEVIERATRRPTYYNPLVPNRDAEGRRGPLISCLLPHVQVCRNFATMLTTRAMLRLGSGETEKAWGDLMTCHRLGRLMGRGSSLIEMLVGIAIETMAIETEAVFLSEAKLDSRWHARMLTDLEQLPAIASLADKIDLSERYFMLDTTKLIKRDGPRAMNELPFGVKKSPSTPGKLFTRSINWDEAMKYENQWIDRVVRVLRELDLATRTAEADKLAAETSDSEVPPEYWTMTADERGQRMGKSIVGVLSPAWRKVDVAVVRIRQRNQLLRTGIHLTQYRADTGKYPVSLSDLVPKQVAKVSHDLFNDGPLRYVPIANGYRLYSVGPDRRDDLNAQPTNDTSDDIMLTMPAIRPMPVANKDE